MIICLIGKSHSYAKGLSMGSYSGWRNFVYTCGHFHGVIKLSINSINKKTGTQYSSGFEKTKFRAVVVKADAPSRCST